MTSMRADDAWSAEVMRGNALSDDVVLQWRNATKNNPEFHSPFYTVSFVQAVARVHPGVRVAVLRRGQTMEGFFPFQFANRLHRSLRAAERVGGEMSDYFGLIATRGVRIDPRELLMLCNLSSLEFSHLDESQLDLGLHGARPEPGLKIQLSAGSAAYWADLKKNDKRLIADTDRRQRKLQDSRGPLKFEFMAADANGELERLVAAKRDQYQRTGVSDPLATEWCVELLRTLANGRHPECQGIMSTLFAGDTWVASHFGLRCGHVLHYWFPAYNHDLRTYSPGRLLLKSIVDSADAEGIRTIDRGAGNHPAKREFANEQHNFFRDIWFVPGPRSLIFRALRSASWRLALRRDRSKRPSSTEEASGTPSDG